MVAVPSRRSFATPRPPARARRAEDPAVFAFDADTLSLVRRLYVARYADMVRAAGIDTEDGYQLVMEGLLRRAQSPRSRWDPGRGAVSTWITVAARGIVLNAIDKHVRAERRNGSLGGESDAADMADSEGTDMSTETEIDTEPEDLPPPVVVRRPALRAVSPTVAPAASAPAAEPQPAPAPTPLVVLPSSLLGRGEAELRAAGEYLAGGGVAPDRAAAELSGVLAWAVGVAADNPVVRLIGRLAVPR